MTEQEMFDSITLELNGYNPKLLTPMKEHDVNWQRLKQEQSVPQTSKLEVAKISCCCFSVWYDSNKVSADYDIAYTNGTKVFNRKINGSWDQIELRTFSENRMLDAIRTMATRLDQPIEINFTRMHEPNDVKTQVREINLVELVYQQQPMIAWFIIGDIVYKARLDELDTQRRRWFFNSRRKYTLDEFCDMCWNSVK
jgi:hypothetical protein